MSDEDIMNDEGDGGGLPSSSPKKGGFSSILMVILKWAAIIVGAIILIVVVVVVTMSIMNKNTPAQTVVQPTENYTTKREVLDWYKSLGQIRAKTNDALPASVIVDVALGYKQADKATPAEITQRSIEIQSFLRRYFSSKSSAELKPSNEDGLRIEIRNAINDDILADNKIKDVEFTSFEVIEQ